MKAQTNTMLLHCLLWLLASALRSVSGLVNGIVVERAEDMPYIARLYLKTGYAEYSICGATLIAPKFLLSAKHCFTDFWDECIEPEDCYASFRNLRPDRNDHDPGEFRIPITEVYEKEGTSDLAVVELKIKVEEHEDYHLGVPITPIKLATKNPKVPNNSPKRP